MRRARPELVPAPRPGESEPAFALVESSVHGLVLSAVNARARREGLDIGLRLADARAAVPHLLTRPADAEADRSALLSLAIWCGRYGPRRHIQGEDGRPPDGVWIDVTGVAHLFGGEAALVGDIARRCRSLGLCTRIGLADTHGAAFALARYGGGIAGAGQAQAALAPLPVEALRLPGDCVVLLKRLGLRRIGQLYGLPRQALAQRFRDSAGSSKRKQAGAAQRTTQLAAQRAGIVLSRLDQALGVVAEPLAALEEPPAYRVRRAFAEPLISAEGVSAAAAELAAGLCRNLDDAGHGGTRFSLMLYRADGTAPEIRIGLSRPGRDPAHLLNLLSPRLETIDAGFGIDVMTLAATETAPLSAAQAALPARGMRESGAGIAPLVDRLANRLGSERVLRLVCGNSHLPERAQRRSPALVTSDRDIPAHDKGSPLSIFAHRPAMLLPAPEPIAVTAEVPEGPPLRFTWRRISRRVVRSEGPERIEPEWWNGIGRTPGRDNALLFRPRDYYRIEDTAGARYWVFRAGLYGREDATGHPPTWFLHGVLG